MVVARVSGGSTAPRRARCATSSTAAEADAIVAALGRHAGDREAAAADLNVSRGYLDARVTALGLRRA